MAINELVKKLQSELKGIENLNIWHSITKHKVCIYVKQTNGTDKLVKLNEDDEPNIDELKKELLN